MDKEDIKITHGLNPLKEDKRDFSLSALVDLPELSELPDSFIVGKPSETDQKFSDFCTGAGSCAISELQEGVPLSFEWAFAMGKSLTGDIESAGLDLRTICKVHVDYGVPERKDVEFTVDNKSNDFLRRIENYPEELKEKAKVHKKGSYVAITGPYDHYDNIRATLWKFREEKRAVVFGVLWGWSSKQVEINTIPQSGGGHCMAIVGWTERGLYVKNSYGQRVGEEGYHYFSREVINKYVGMYGAFTFLDLPKEEVWWYNENKICVDGSTINQSFKAIKSLFKKIFNLK